MSTKILLFEWMTGGGRWVDRSTPDPACPFQLQGRQMLTDVLEDMLELGLEVTVPIDERMELNPSTMVERISVGPNDDLIHVLKGAASRVDGILLIAPESDGCLLNLCNQLSFASDNFLGPDRDFVAMATDKSATCNKLAQHGIPVPTGITVKPKGQLVSQAMNEIGVALPAIRKPIDGAGSEHVAVVEDWTWLKDADPESSIRVESLIVGTPVSVSVICNSKSVEILTPTGQVLDCEPVGKYVNAQHPLPLELERRAKRLAEMVVECVRPRRGYFGIDMVLGDEGDYVIEINPRITASYSLLRKIESRNLVAEMLK